MKIFLTIGTQLPFDRLVRCVDKWVGENGRAEVDAQMLEGDYRPVNFGFRERVGRVDFEAAMANADITVSHAGMGTVITALHFNKPLVVLPRRRALREHRTDHQMATARWLDGAGYVAVVYNCEELAVFLSSGHRSASRRRVSAFAEERLLRGIRNAIVDCR